MVALAIITANSFAQVQSDIQSATLIHGDQTRVFYGMNAFSSACSAAADEGDIIVLSAGSFNSGSDITKSLTIYGRGYTTDTESGLEPTILSNGLKIVAKESQDEQGNQVYVYPEVTLEGLYFPNYDLKIDGDTHGATLKNLKIRKCKGNFESYTDSENCLVTQSVFSTFNFAYTGCTAKQFNIENSWIGLIKGNKDVTNNVNFDHCIIQNSAGGPYTNMYYYNSGIAHYTNSIIYSSLPTYSTSSNNIFVSSSGSTETVDANGNWLGVSNALVWEEGNEDGSYDDTKTYAIKFPTKYVGTDGTQVGINGGHAPFDRISPIPRILAAEVDLRTAEDGKLNVSFKVEAQTKE